MTVTCPKQPQGMNDDGILLETYEPNIGAPFRVILVNSIHQTISRSGEVEDTCIPNMGGLLKEVALARSLHPRKLSSSELKFIRKAIGLRALELADLLGVSAEHLSRCENGDRVLSASAEKLLRVIVLKRRYNYAAISEGIAKLLDDDDLEHTKIDRLKATFTEYNQCIADLETAVFASKLDAAHDVSSKLVFEFRLRIMNANENHSQEDEDWKRAAA